MESEVTAAIITGCSAITLCILKYIVQCLCPGHLSCDSRRGCCRSKPSELNPIISLQNLWEERWMPNNDGELIQDAEAPRGFRREYYDLSKLDFFI